jgi:Zn-dependent protease with chaperone function
VSAQHLILEAVGHHLIPCLLASAVTFLALVLIFLPLRRPAHRVLFLYAAIFKAALALWLGVGASCLEHRPALFFNIHLRLPSFMPAGSLFEMADRPDKALLQSDLSGWMLLAILALALALACRRWARLAPVYRAIYESHTAAAADFPQVFAVFDQLAARARRRWKWPPRARLMLIRNAPSPAFTMGLRQPVIMLSVELAESLGERELRGVLAHELAHVRRFDYLGRWLATILRDIMIWNPFVLMWHLQLIHEQENACDEYAAELLQDPAAVASGLVEVGALQRGLPVASLGLLTAWGKRRNARALTRRVDALVDAASRPPARYPFPTLLVYVPLFAFILTQVRLAVSLPRVYSLLQRLF